jgi:hypothetical protein
MVDKRGIPSKNKKKINSMDSNDDSVNEPQNE